MSFNSDFPLLHLAYFGSWKVGGEIRPKRGGLLQKEAILIGPKSF